MEISSGDTAWMIVSTALVMFMTPGLALFYGGLVRGKNVLGTIMQSLFALGLVSIIWFVAGYTLAFGPSGNTLIGGLDFLFLRDVGAEPFALAPTIPHSVYMAFQMMFAVITPALITGAVAERMRFRGYVLFLLMWSLLVYSPVAHWVWGGGFLGLGDGNVGALDFAGGTVVHINAGVAALAAIFYIGKRHGFGKEAIHPHNIPMVVTGAAILWFGWFGFNAGSALASNGLAGAAFINTHLATAAAMLGWLAVEWIRNKVPTTIGAATGAVGGLVAVTPAAGFVEPWAAVVIGLAAGMICYGAVSLKAKISFDDSLDVVGVHMVGGLVGALLTGIFATEAISGIEGANGLLYGNAAQLGKQAIAVGVTIGYSFLATLFILKVTDMLVGVRVTHEEELTGLDLSQHAETAYTTVDRGTVATPPVGAGSTSASHSVVQRTAEG
ncbi:MAG: ammonium transporter [Actinobacteria bacterium]|nr:ammonium transporter [Actinomycetota bacterium]